MSYKTITGTYAGGYAVAAGVNGLTLTATAKVGGAGVSDTTALKVFNYGSITAGSDNDGVFLKAGGLVDNESGGFIYGGDAAVETYAAGTVFNYGRIEAYHTAIDLRGPGVSEVINGSGLGATPLIAGYVGVTIYAGIIENFGTISGGAQIFQGGSVVNGGVLDSVAVISGGKYGVVVGESPAGAVFNYGTISGRSIGVLGGGKVTNGTLTDRTALIEGRGGLLLSATATVVNFGAIVGSGDNGVALQAGGAITNGAAGDTGALIDGSAGVKSYVGATLTNFGTVRGESAVGVTFAAGGAVTNGTATDTQARISGYTGIVMTGAAAGAVANFGTIEGISAAIGAAGVSLDHGSVANGSGGDTKALISGYYGVWAHNGPGAVSNFGAILAVGGPKTPAVFLQNGGYVVNGSVDDTSALISGGGGVVVYAASGTVTNFGTISSTAAAATAFGGYGVVLQAGGAVTNGSATDHVALLSGYRGGVGVLGAAGTVANFATIRGTGGTGQWGARVTAGGTVTNGTATDTTALIEGYNGLTLQGVSATNFGTIIGQGAAGTDGALAGAGAHLTNRVGGLIDGYTGLVVQGSGVATNFGTIVGLGGVAVTMGSTASVLAVEAGATFIGSVNGGGGTLDLASGSGTITSLLVGGKVTETGSATTFANFGTLEVGAGASFTVSGSGTIAAGQGLIVAGTLTEAGTLTIAGSLTTTGTLAGTGTLALTGGTSNFNTGTALTIAKVTQSGGTANSGSTTLTYAGVWTQTVGTVSAATGDKFSFTGVGDKFLGTLAGAGTVAFTGGTDALTGTTIKAAHVTIGAATVTLSGTISNASVVNVTDPSVIVAAAGASLTGAGSINLSNVATNMIKGATAGSTLTNVSNKITGAGNLGGGQMTLVNQVGGTINGNLSLGLTIDTGANAIANAGIIENTATGGTTVKSAVVNTGYLIVTKGVLAVNGAVTGAGTVKIGGGTADFASTFTENVVFTSTTGVLELSHSQTYTGSVTGFSHTGTSSLDLLDIGFTAGTTKAAYVGTVASGVLTVTDGTHTAKIGFTGDYTAATWTVSSDGHGGTTVVDPTKQAVTQPHAPLLGFIAAAAGFGARAGPVSATGETWRGAIAALAAPRAHLA